MSVEQAADRRWLVTPRQELSDATNPSKLPGGNSQWSLPPISSGLVESSTLETLIRTAETHGWAEEIVAPPGGASIWFTSLGSRLESQAKGLGLVPVENRRGQPHVSTLRPTTPEGAHPASLSAQVGLGQQPLHTDGAHLRKVPDYVVMWSETTNATPTRVWHPRRALWSGDRSGIFMIRSGRETWLSPAHDVGGLRFDPGCMSPCDAFARETTRILESPPANEVHEIHWDAPGKVLVLANRQVLHGRAAVTDGDQERTLSRVAYYKAGAR